MMTGGKTSALRKLCEIHRISPDVVSALEWQAGHLRTFKDEILPPPQTPTRRAKALERVATLAAELRGAIEELPFDERLALDNEFFGVDEPGFPDAFELVGDARAFDLGGDTVPGIERAAQAVLARLTGVHAAGAPKVTERYADFIRCIAQELKPANIAPAATGKFEELCGAVFEEAGLTLSERAMRYFLKNMRPALKASGRCL